MKNNFSILAFLILSIIPSYSQNYIFETKDLEIDSKQEFIKAGEGKVLSEDNQIEIFASYFEYDKKKRILTAKGNGLAKLKKNSLEMKFDEIQINKTLGVIRLTGDNLNILLNNKFLMSGDEFEYDENKEIISSNKKITSQDLNQNLYEADKFRYDLNNALLKFHNLKLKDSQNNNLEIPIAFIDTNTSKLIGKDFNLNLNNSLFANNKNEPRFKGRSIVIENDITKIDKGAFTTCKARDGCPPWQLTAKKIYHDKKNQLIKYDDAILRLYDFPVLYFPKFFHPDPEVERKSGFLIPTFNLSSVSSHIVTPYFYAISDSEDMTFSPRIYDNGDILLQNEFRKVNKNSSHITDLSILNTSSGKQKSHFFHKFSQNLNLENFDLSTINLNIQQISNENYLKKRNISSVINESKDILENSLNLKLSKNDFEISANLTSYEDLNKEDSDKFEFIYPQIDIKKKIDSFYKMNGEFLLTSNNLVRNFDTNNFEKYNINNIKFKSDKIFSQLGLENNYEFLIKNANLSEDGMSGKKDEIYLSGLLQFNTSLPLIKKSDDYNKIIKPKLSLKIAPSNTKNISNDNSNRLNSLSLFNLERIQSKKTIEGGMSLALGNEYKVYDKNNSKEILSVNIANNLRIKENFDLPKNHQIGQKSSNVFTEIMYIPNDFLSLGYDTSLKNNFSDLSYEKISSKFTLNKIVTEFNYVNENESDEKNSFLDISSSLNLDKNKILKFSTRENKLLNFREYYNLLYQYSIDCLRATVEYNKSYYEDRDLKPEEKILFKLSIVPIGTTNLSSTN